MDTWAKIIIGDSREMGEVAAGAVDLVVTSPPYWHIKDYGMTGQIGYGQSLHDYLRDLYRVWQECFRVLRPGGRLCVNVGDQFARAAVYGRYKVIPLHAEIIGHTGQDADGYGDMGGLDSHSNESRDAYTDIYTSQDVAYAPFFAFGSPC